MRYPFLSLAIVCLSACSVLQPKDTPVFEPAIHSVADADRIEAAAAVDRARAEALFAEREVVCYQKFFVNSCLDDAREIRRTALAPVRAAEVASARFKREASVLKRDRELAEAEVAYQAKLKQAIIDEAAQPPAAPAEAAPATATKEKKPGLTLEQRVARREAREQEAATRQKQQAARHADNVAAQEAKRLESKERLRRVEEKKAAKARGRETD
jgi:colicin import membrane protein